MEGEEGEHDVVPRAVCDEERPCARAARGAAATPRLLLARLRKRLTPEVMSEMLSAL